MCNIVKFDKNIKVEKQTNYLLILNSNCYYSLDIESVVGRIMGYLDGHRGLNGVCSMPHIRLYEIATSKNNKNEQINCLYSSDNPIDLKSLL